MSTRGTPATIPAPPEPAPDAFARALRGFGPVGIAASLFILLFSAILGPLRAAFPLAWAWRSRTPWAELGLSRPRSWVATVVVGLALGAAFKLVMKSVVMPLLGAPPENPAFQFLRGNTPALAWMLLAVTLGAGLGEELVFRGFFFHRLEQLLGRGARAKVAIVILTSLVFGLGHLAEQGVPGAQQATLSGLVMGTIYARSRNLWLPVIAHATFDIVAVFIIYLGLERWWAHLIFR